MAIITVGIFSYSYHDQTRDIETNIRNIEAHALPQITASIWDYADVQVDAEFDALCKLRHVSHVAISSSEHALSFGHPENNDVISRRFDLVPSQGGSIGTLDIQFSLASARQAIFKEGLVLLAYVLIPLVTMAIATLLMFRGLVTRPLDALAQYARSLTVDTLDLAFRFRHRNSNKPDELDRLLAAIDAMRTNMLAEIQNRRQAEQQLRETEAYYREVFNSTGDAIVLHDKNTGQIVDVNQTMLDMYRCTYEEAVAVSPDFFSEEIEGQSPNDALERILMASQGDPQVFEWRAKRTDGEIFWAEVFLKTMAPESGGRILASVRDISARKAAEEKLIHIQKMESIGQLAGGIAHDFNNLLSGILGAAEMISTTSEDPEILEDVDMIITTANRAADLTGQLLAFARRGPIVLTQQDLHDIIKDVVLILQRSIDKRITLDMDLAAQDSLVRGDRSQLQAAFLNLGLNARDAMPDGGNLTISTALVVLDEDVCRTSAFPMEPGQYVEARLSDTGAGMTDEVVKKAFEPFFTTKTIGKGTGLGLASVYGTVKGHHGAVFVESVLNQGTTIRLLLPLSVSGPATEVVAPKVAEPHVGQGCILVIEDEEMVRTTTRNGLERVGYEVLLAQDGLEGCDIYRRYHRKVDLIILDMIMPKLNGEETFKAIRDINSNARILLASGFSQNQAVTDLLALGGAGFLRKPFRRSDLLTAIGDLLSDESV